MTPDKPNRDALITGIRIAIHNNDVTQVEKDTAEEELAAIVAYIEPLERLREAVNDFPGNCKPECDSYGHAKDCAYVDNAAIIPRMQEKIQALEAENAKLRAACQDFVDWCCKSQGAPSAEELERKTRHALATHCINIKAALADRKEL